MAFAQLTGRESLRAIEACLRATPSRLYHAGIRSNDSRSTLAHANQVRDWRIYAAWDRSSIVDTQSIMLPGVVRSTDVQRLPVSDSPVAFESAVDCRTLQCTQ